MPRTRPPYPPEFKAEAILWGAQTRSGPPRARRRRQRTGQPAGSIAKVPCTGDALAVGAGGVWCFDPATDRAPARFNPRSGQVDVAMQPGEAIGGTALAASPGSIWVLTGNQLVRVDLG